MGPLVAERLGAAGHKVVEKGPVDAVVDVAFAWQNSLLHDGWKWKGFARFAPAHASQLMEAARAAQAGLVVLAGFALAAAGPFDDPDLRPPLEVESALRSGDLPLCALRLGWLYGPRMQNLRQYRAAFQWLRPYYGGPHRMQSWLHEEDAADAVVAALEKGRPGDLYGVADERPASNRQVLDYFAWTLVHRPPVSFPRLGLRFSPVQQAQALVLDRSSVVDPAPFRAATGWRPVYPTYIEGLASVAVAWSSRR